MKMYSVSRVRRYEEENPPIYRCLFGWPALVSPLSDDGPATGGDDDGVVFIVCAFCERCDVDGKILFAW